MKQPKPRKIPKAQRIARVLHQRVAHDRSKGAASERENHLRSLMGLPAAQRQRSLLDDASEASE